MNINQTKATAKFNIAKEQLNLLTYNELKQAKKYCTASLNYQDDKISALKILRIQKELEYLCYHRQEAVTAIDHLDNLYYYQTHLLRKILVATLKHRRTPKKFTALDLADVLLKTDKYHTEWLNQ